MSERHRGCPVPAEVARNLLDAILDDDAERVLALISSCDGADLYFRQIHRIVRVPYPLRVSPSVASYAAVFRSLRTFQLLVSLGLDHTIDYFRGLGLVHYVCIGGSFSICRELDSLGNVDWNREIQYPCMPRHPAEFAAAFGHLNILRWLWVRGALSSVPGIGWYAQDEGDPPILLVAARCGHADVMRFLVEEVGIPLLVGCPRLQGGDLALHSACRAGHADVAKVLLELGAGIDTWRESYDVLPTMVAVHVNALGEAARAGGLRCVRVLLEHGGECFRRADGGEIDAIDPATMAVVGGHADILRMLLPLTTAEERDSAFSVACILRREPCKAVLPGSRFVWSALVAKVLCSIPAEECGRVCTIHLPTFECFAEWAWPAHHVLLALRPGVVGGSLAREVVECGLASCSTASQNGGVRWFDRVDVIDWAYQLALWGIGLHPERCLACPTSGDLGLVRCLLEPDPRLAADAYGRAEPGAVAELLRQGEPLIWARYRAGGEYLPWLTRVDLGGCAPAIAAAFRDRGVTLTRHCFCGVGCFALGRARPCSCGWRTCPSFAEELRLLVGLGAQCCGRGGG